MAVFLFIKINLVAFFKNNLGIASVIFYGHGIGIDNSHRIGAVCFYDIFLNPYVLDSIIGFSMDGHGGKYCRNLTSYPAAILKSAATDSYIGW